MPALRRYVETFEPYDYVVSPSGSCVGSVRDQHPMLADRSGEAALVRLYDRLSTGDDLDTALRSGFGWTERDLLTAWRTRLSDLPRAGGGAS